VTGTASEAVPQLARADLLMVSAVGEHNTVSFTTCPSPCSRLHYAAGVWSRFRPW